MSDYFAFILYCIITIVVHFFVLCKAIITKNERFWYFIWSIFGGIILSSISGTFLLNSFDPDCTPFVGWDSLYYLFGCRIIIIIGFIVMIIGFIVKLKLKKNNKLKTENYAKSNKIIIFFITNIIMVFLLLLTLIIPYQIKLHNFKELEIYSKEYLDNYLDNEYGKENYEIIRFERDYSYNGIISKYFIGFEATIHLNNMNDYFSVYVEGTNKNELRIEDEIIYRKNLNLPPLN